MSRCKHDGDMCRIMSGLSSSGKTDDLLTHYLCGTVFPETDMSYTLFLHLHSKTNTLLSLRSTPFQVPPPSAFLPFSSPLY